MSSIRVFFKSSFWRKCVPQDVDHDVPSGFDVNKVGDARIGFVGFPSVGKSTLLTKLTGTFSEV